MITLETYAAVLADGMGRGAVDWAAIAAARGVGKQEWEQGMAHWAAKTGQEEKLQRKLVKLMHEAMVATDGDVPMGLDTYVEISVEVQTGRPPADVFAAHGLDERRYSCASYGWMTRLARDPQLDVYFRLRVRRGIAQRTKKAPRDEFAVYGPANLIRARRCRNCGALKASVPTTAYVYCDYCATLFDYDSSIVRNDPTALDPGEVDGELRAVSGDRLAAARKRDDRAEYARIVAWMNEVSTEVSPLEYSPRIRDPEYRQKFVHELIVPWTMATQFDPTWKELSKKFNEAASRAMYEKKLSQILALLQVGRTVWKRERELLETGGILAKHPDGVDGELFEYVNVSTFVRPWLGALNDADQAKLLETSGTKHEFVPAPKVDFAALGCGKCGAQLQAPAGAKRMLCEHCGFILELETRRFPCQGCGASLSLPAVGDGVQCGYCHASWARS